MPKSLGGTDEDDNLITLCSMCHGNAHGMVRRDIGELTRAGLSEAKARGVKLGNPNGAAHLKGRGNREAIEGARSKADEFARKVTPVFAALKAQGFISAGSMARELNTRGVPTARGGAWTARAVINTMTRKGE